MARHALIAVCLMHGVAIVEDEPPADGAVFFSTGLRIVIAALDRIIFSERFASHSSLIGNTHHALLAHEIARTDYMISGCVIRLVYASSDEKNESYCKYDLSHVSLMRLVL